MKDKTPIADISQCPICGSGVKEIDYSNGMTRIRCASRNRCINVVGENHAILRDLLQNLDWRSIAEEAKPCPRCGGDEVSIWRNKDNFWIQCERIGCLVYSCGESLSEVMALWKELVCDAQVDAVEEAAKKG